MPRAEHPDPIVRDLQAIRKLRWHQPEGFQVLEVLLTHPLVAHFAFQPKKDRHRVKALEAALKEVTDRIGQREGDSPPLGRSVAAAGTALLRLSPEFASMPIERIRQHVADSWGRRAGGSLTPNSFRQHLEVPEVYEKIAAEFQLFARQQAEDYAKASAEEEIAVTEEGDVGPVAGLEGAEASPETVADALRAMESKLYRNRLVHIDEGELRVRSEDEMLGVLVTLTNTAKREYRAVDYVGVSEWFASPRLNRYLTVQLQRVKEGIKLVRIRVVRAEELQYESRHREQLERLVELHEEAGATLLLCREETIEKLELEFAPHVGLFIIDAETEPAAVTGKLSGDGSIGRARVYIGDTEDVRQFRQEYETLRATAQEQNRELRAQLARLR